MKCGQYSPLRLHKPEAGGLDYIKNIAYLFGKVGKNEYLCITNRRQEK